MFYVNFRASWGSSKNNSEPGWYLLGELWRGNRKFWCLGACKQAAGGRSGIASCTDSREGKDDVRTAELKSSLSHPAAHLQVRRSSWSLSPPFHRGQVSEHTELRCHWAEQDLVSNFYTCISEHKRVSYSLIEMYVITHRKKVLSKSKSRKKS